MAMSFLKPNASDEITVDSVIPENILPLQYINVGDECQKFLDNCDSEIAEKMQKLLFRTISGEQKQHISSLTLENMWAEVFKAEYSPGVPVFDNLKTLVDMVLILPHSNAEAERTFSNVTDILTKKRNRIGNDTVAAICKFHLWKPESSDDLDRDEWIKGLH
ncbi:hypothetical protein PV325_010321 [Microctonus aethiopoides]|nr:hypothetical protein PV325_010321 [Microctonus aethiopoides]